MNNVNNVNNVNSDPLWTSKPSILLNKPYEFWPNKTTQTPEECFNAFTRLIIIYGIVFSLYYKSSRVLLWSVVVVLFIGILGKQQMKKKTCNKHVESLSGLKKETFHEKKPCRTSTVDNPYMNPMMAAGDHLMDVCKSDFNNEELKQHNFLQDVPHHEWDVFKRNSSVREFNTVPVHNIPNDQDSFAKWLYGDSTNCKLRTRDCKPNEVLG